MLKSKLNQLRASEGFTIIEVIIVLVIAAVIMLMVFLVVPQLQRSQRNSRNQSVARQAFTAAEQYAANNSGKYPTTIADIEAITGSLKNASNAQFTKGTTATPSTTEMSFWSNVAPCDDANSVGSVVANSGGRFKLVVSQETSTKADGGVFCISN